MGQKERLKEYIEYKGLKTKAFELGAGLSNGFVSSIRVGIGHSALQKISEHYTDLNIPWLLTGQGVMLNASEPSGPSLEDIGTAPVPEVKVKEGEISALITELQKQREIIETAQGHISILLSIIEKGTK